MKFPTKAYFPILVFLFFLSVSSVRLQAQEIDQDLCLRTAQLYNTIANYHFDKMNNRDLNDRIVDELIQSLDYYGILFTQTDVESIKSLKNRINVDLVLGSCSFPSAAFEIYKDRALAFDSIMSLDGMWENDFNIQDSIILQSRIQTTKYVENEEALIESIRKRIKYLTLLEYQSSLDSTEVSTQDFENKKIKLTNEIRQLERCRISQFFETDNALMESFMDDYLKAIASSFDPHTNYMSIKEMNEFEFSLSEEVYSTGLILDEVRNGVYIIAGIIPGSTASEMNEISEGDELLKITFNNKEVHPACLKTIDLLSLLNDQEPKEVTMSLRKQNGGVIKVNIKKTFINNISNEIGSLILEDEVRVGYVALPSFYRSIDDPQSNSASDISEQVEIIKTKNIDGLIIDLRFNGGGSVLEAVELASLFIPKGALIQEVSRNDQTILKDKNKGVIYNGNIILLVNTISASASEMFTSMMNAHQRAIIVGNQTYGKASGQLMGPMALPGESEEYGALKLTVLRYYNLDGSSFQQTGFTPDILVADGIPEGVFSESLHSYALPINKIEKRVKVKKKSKSIPLDVMKKKSAERQNNNPIYYELTKLSDSLELVMKNSLVIPLDVEGFISATKPFSIDSSRYDYKIDKNFRLEVISGLTQFGTNTDKRLIYEIGSDPTLREAINIMKDWNSLTDK